MTCALFRLRLSQFAWFCCRKSLVVVNLPSGATVVVEKMGAHVGIQINEPPMLEAQRVEQGRSCWQSPSSSQERFPQGVVFVDGVVKNQGKPIVLQTGETYCYKQGKPIDLSNFGVSMVFVKHQPFTRLIFTNHINQQCYMWPPLGIVVSRLVGWDGISPSGQAKPLAAAEPWLTLGPVGRSPSHIRVFLKIGG